MYSSKLQGHFYKQCERDHFCMFFDSPTPPPPANDSQLAITKRTIDPDVEDISIEQPVVVEITTAQVKTSKNPSLGN